MSSLTDSEIKLLVVEDSSFMRQLIKDLLSDSKNIKVELASNGKNALQKIKKSKPDLMTLDIEMDVMNGLELLEELKRENLFVPTIMLSQFTKKDSNMAIQALELGAIDVLHKPESVNYEVDIFKKDLNDKINMSLKSYVKQRAIINKNKVRIKNAFIIPKVMVIGSSTGGPTALQEIFLRLPKIKIPIILVQHMPVGFTESMAKRLNELSEMTIKLAEQGDSLEPETVYVAPSNYHLTITDDFKINLDKSPTVNAVRPSIDVTLKSVAKVFNGRALSVILTGMGEDGADGVNELRKVGGKCIAQDKVTSAVFGMPEAVINAGNADCIAPLDKIPEEIVRYLLNWN